MSSPLTLIVLGQAYFFSTPKIATGGGIGGISVPGIDQSLFQNGTSLPGYTYTPGIGSHKVYTTVKTWIKALKTCRDEGAHLAIINSRAEANLISRLFAAAGPHPESYSPNNAWIGTHDLISQQGNYETIFGESLAQAGFDEWHEPRSLEGPYCGAAFRDGELSWFGCSQKLGFICELPNSQSYATNGITQDATELIRGSLKMMVAEKLDYQNQIAAH